MPSGNISRKVLLLSIKSLLNYCKKKQILRVCLADLTVNPATGHLYPFFSAISKFTLLSFRNIWQNKASYRYAIWFNPSKNNIHLSIDELVHILGNHLPFLLEATCFLKLLKPGGYPNNTLSTKIFCSIISRKWDLILPSYKSYSFPASRVLLLVVLLDRFIAGYLYQIRMSRCSLKASKSLCNKDKWILYIYCMLEDKIFIYAIVACPSKTDLRKVFILDHTVVFQLSNI